jgi:hypothetical protein
MLNKKSLFWLLIVVCVIVALFTAASAPYPGEQPSRLQQATPTASAQVSSSCLNRLNIPESETSWTYIPTSADELYSDENLQYLAGRLISQGIVDASSCPAGGLAANGYATACGTELAQPTVVAMQNAVNQAIIDQYYTVGVPPVLLKQLIQVESQFWPSSEVKGHFGYGHVTYAGMETALDYYPDLVDDVCSLPGNNCAGQSLSAETMLEMMVSTCPTCENGIDMSKANDSILILAKVIMAYCDQTAQLVYNATGWRSDLVVDYPTLWKLTLMNYNSGATCTFNTMAAAFKRTNGPVDWPNISVVTTTSQCLRGLYYANQITTASSSTP